MLGSLLITSTRPLRWAAVLGVTVALVALGEASARGPGEALARSPRASRAVGSVARATSASADPAACPLEASAQAPSGEAWAFTQTGPPSTPHPGVNSSYTHGRGTWADGRGTGTICNEDSTAAHASHNLVLTVAGASHISPRITRLGHLGVGLVLKVTVSASDDQTCPSGTRGTVTLFASYFQEHHDSVQLHFTGGCSAYDYTYTGSGLHVLIADDGRQVN
jgi:hypothetical protein